MIFHNLPLAAQFLVPHSAVGWLSSYNVFSSAGYVDQNKCILVV